MFSRLPVERLSTTATSCPLWRRCSATYEPINPAPPVKRTRTSGAFPECCVRRSGWRSSLCLRREPFQGLREAFTDGGLRFPTQRFSGAGYIRATLCGSVLGQRLMGDLALRARELYDHLGDLTHRVLDRIADVDRSGLLAFHQPDHAFDQVLDILHAPGPGAFSVDGQGLAEEGLSYKVRHHPAIIYPHFRTVAIKNAHDSRVHPVVAMVGHCQGLGVTLGLVVDAPWTRGAYVAPVVLMLRVHERVAVDLRGGGEHKAGPPGAGKSKAVVGTKRAGLKYLNRDAPEVGRARGGGEMVDLI